MTIRRGFADIGTNFAEGLQLHYRTAGSGGPRPVSVLHPSPGSAKMMKPLIQAHVETMQAIELDKLGNGDSSTPALAEPDIANFARAHMCGLVAHFLAMRSAL